MSAAEHPRCLMPHDKGRPSRFATCRFSRPSTLKLTHSNACRAWTTTPRPQPTAVPKKTLIRAPQQREHRGHQQINRQMLIELLLSFDVLNGLRLGGIQNREFSWLKIRTINHKDGGKRTLRFQTDRGTLLDALNAANAESSQASEMRLCPTALQSKFPNNHARRPTSKSLKSSLTSRHLTPTATGQTRDKHASSRVSTGANLLKQVERFANRRMGQTTARQNSESSSPFTNVRGIGLEPKNCWDVLSINRSTVTTVRVRVPFRETLGKSGPMQRTDNPPVSIKGGM